MGEYRVFYLRRGIFAGNLLCAVRWLQIMSIVRTAFPRSLALAKNPIKYQRKCLDISRQFPTLRRKEPATKSAVDLQCNDMEYPGSFIATLQQRLAETSIYQKSHPASCTYIFSLVALQVQRIGFIIS